MPTSLSPRSTPLRGVAVVAAAVATLLLPAGCLYVKMDVNAKVDMDIRLKADRVIEEYLSEINQRRVELQRAALEETTP